MRTGRANLGVALDAVCARVAHLQRAVPHVEGATLRDAQPGREADAVVVAGCGRIPDEGRDGAAGGPRARESVAVG